MVPSMVKEAAELRKALAGKGKNISISFSRDTAELVAKVLDAKVDGKEILVARSHKEVSPSEAASILGFSRPQVRKIMDSGRLPFRMVGSHHRIAVRDIQEFANSERLRQEKAMKRLVDLENELGLFD